MLCAYWWGWDGPSCNGNHSAPPPPPNFWAWPMPRILFTGDSTFSVHRRQDMQKTASVWEVLRCMTLYANFFLCLNLHICHVHKYQHKYTVKKGICVQPNQLAHWYLFSGFESYKDARTLRYHRVIWYMHIRLFSGVHWVFSSCDHSSGAVQHLSGSYITASMHMHDRTGYTHLCLDAVLLSFPLDIAQLLWIQ